MILLLAAAALASPSGLALPPSERSADWEQPLTVAGLVGTLDGATVAFEVRGSQWVVHTRTGAGATRSATIEAPTDEASRERVCLLVASLLSSATPALPLPELPVRAPAAQAEQGPRPRAKRISLASSEEAWQPPTEPDEVAAAVAGIPQVPPTPTPRRARAPGTREAPAGADPAAASRPAPWWISARGGMAMRQPQAPYASLSVVGGPLLGARSRLGLGATFATPTRISVGQTDLALAATDGYLGAWLGGLVEVGGLAGLSRRTASQLPDARVAPFLGTEASLVLQVGPQTLLRAPTIRFERDLVATWVVFDDEAVGLPRAALHVDFEIVFLGKPDHSPRVGALSKR